MATDSRQMQKGIGVVMTYVTDDATLGRLARRQVDLFRRVAEGTLEAEGVLLGIQNLIEGQKQPQPTPTIFKPTTYLRRLYQQQVIKVSATKGPETFQGSDVFGNRVYGLSLPDGEGTFETIAEIHELVENGTFAEIFGRLDENRPRWQNQGQVLNFCRDYRDKLRTGGYGTFFELVGGFVADVGVGAYGQLFVCVGSLDDGLVWYAEYQHRFVVPQQ